MAICFFLCILQPPSGLRVLGLDILALYMESISLQYPAWYLVFCLLLGLAYALLLYYRDKTFKEQSENFNRLLGVLRFLAVSIIAVLLLSPLLKSVITESKKPIIVLAQDQSESIPAGMKAETLKKYEADFSALATDLGKDYEVKQYAFGNEFREGVDFKYTEKITNIAELLSGVNDLYSNQNLGAIVLATDGIYNEGSNPVYLNTKLTAPVYSVALGDTTARRDVVLKRIFNNRIAYLGDQFSVQADIAAQNSTGSNTTLSVYKVEGANSRLLQQMQINIDRNDFFTTKTIVLNADQGGVQRFRISLSPVAGEASKANNSKEIFVDVLDARQKVLLLAHSPHPDIAALRQMLTINKNYEVKIAYINDLKVNVADFDFVVLHQLPALNNDAAAVLNVIRSRKLPVLFIAGTQTNYVRLNQAQSLVSIRAASRNTNEVQGIPGKDFNLFTVDETLKTNISNFAPLTAPFGEYDVSAKAQVLLYQRIGRVDTRYPLLVMGDDNGARVGVLCAEGIWKWRLFDFMQNQNHNFFNELIGKTVQYVSLKDDKRKFRVNLAKNIFNENEPALFDAELYNDNYELINDPDASMVVTSAEGREFPFTFNKSGKLYTLNAGSFPVGNYRFRAAVNSSGENLTYNGQFSVQPIELELYEITADHNLLRLLSDKYGGSVVYPAQLLSVADLIREKTTIKPVIYQTAKTRPVINLKWVFFLLLALVSTEWFLRRYFGGY